MIEHEIISLLSEKKFKLATAESCTGGLLAKRITAVEGCSACFDCGVVSYANHIKEKLLGVDGAVIKKMGAVSAPVALQMARGIIKLSGSDLGIGITGLAGPTGGSETKPVGLVYIALADNRDFEICNRFVFEGGRGEIRQSSADSALLMVWEYIKNGQYGQA